MISPKMAKLNARVAQYRRALVRCGGRWGLPKDQRGIALRELARVERQQRQLRRLEQRG